MRKSAKTNVVPIENLNWAFDLACSPSVCNSDVAQILNRGISSYVWDEISSKIYPVDDVIESRKNILLHYLQNNVPIDSIQFMKNTKRLIKEREIVASQIRLKHVECKKTDASLRQKGRKLSEIQSQKRTVQLKKNALEMKSQETKAGMNDFREMFLVCQTLLPSFRSDIDENIMQESLALAGAISSRADKREALKQLSENFGTSAIAELWSWILNRRICDTEKLVNHGFQYKSLEKPKHKHGERLSVGIAKACGQHVMNTTAKLMHKKRGDTERARGLDYLEKIENFFNDTNENIQDWLTVTVEVAQLQENYRIMQAEIDAMKTLTERADDLRTRHLQLASEIHDINVHMEECANKIQQALLKFEPTGQSLTILKNQLTTALNMIAVLNHQTNVDWQADSLSPEIEIFQDNLDINALNKVLLSGRVGAYRHATTCMSNALSNIHVSTSSFPIYHTPLSHLICCFENLATHYVLSRQKVRPTILSQLEDTSKTMCSDPIRQNDTLELLHDTNNACEKCQSEVRSFHSVYESWVYQLASESMSFGPNTVHGATYEEWVQRYATLVYMVQRNK